MASHALRPHALRIDDSYRCEVCGHEWPCPGAYDAAVQRAEAAEAERERTLQEAHERYTRMVQVLSVQPANQRAAEAEARVTELEAALRQIRRLIAEAPVLESPMLEVDGIVDDALAGAGPTTDWQQMAGRIADVLDDLHVPGPNGDAKRAVLAAYRAAKAGMPEGTDG